MHQDHIVDRHGIWSGMLVPHPAKGMIAYLVSRRATSASSASRTRTRWAWSTTPPRVIVAFLAQPAAPDERTSTTEREAEQI